MAAQKASTALLTTSFAKKQLAAIGSGLQKIIANPFW